ncbi:MAG: conjugal transfer protein TraR [Hydrogenophilales bacterium 12-61-10]|nr:MAG: conjugal transfer protein TraR [Hydrogenophilales bacterium 12-61-10]OYX29684.1 MAG: conjugal transfer protein TraR [Hydrogenophilales bacterium 32-62-9]
MTPLTPSQIDQLTLQLKKDYQALLIEVGQELANSGNQHRIELLNREPGDSGDESLASSLADFNLAVVDRHVHELRDIESTFKRFKDATYGVCVDCGDSISFARLQAYPTAKRCLACQEKHEREYAQGGHSSM